MHITQTINAIGYIDNKTITNNNLKANGWCMSNDFVSKPLRVVSEGVIIYPSLINRPDVTKFYKISDLVICGWEFNSPLPCVLQMEYNGNWVNVFSFKKNMQNFPINKTIPSYIVVDNFYKNPDHVREFALKCNFKLHEKLHKGERTEETYRFDGIKERFEEIIGKKIINWEKYGTNGCFQYCIGGDQLVYHTDSQQYAGVLFLTPDAPIQSGTCLYRSKHTKKMKVSKEEQGVVFSRGYLDSTEFELVDKIGNIYNRVVLFDSRCIHAASDYFGNAKENSRLFQLFFFDLSE